MNDIDIAALEQISKGDGELRLSKRLVRGLLARMRASEAADRSRAMIDRMVGTVAA